jgi:glucose/mannose-6-phosphate isomerase
VIVGAELTAPVAYRWKTQLNENAKVPAFAAALPELDHNDVVGWGSAADFARFAAVFLEDRDGERRMRRRTDLTAEVVAAGADVVERVGARGTTRLERMLSLVLLGDLVSIYVAVLRGVDPGDVELLERLKAALAHR